MRTPITLLSLTLTLLVAGCDDEPPPPPGPLESRMIGNTLLEHPDLKIVISGVGDDEPEPVLFGTETFSIEFDGVPFEQSPISSTRIEWSTNSNPYIYGELGREPTLGASLLQTGVQRITATVYRHAPRSAGYVSLYLTHRVVRVQRAETPRSISLQINRNNPGAHIDRVYLEGEAYDSAGVQLPHQDMTWYWDPHGVRQELGRGPILYTSLGEGTHEIGLGATAPGHADALVWTSVEVVHTQPPPPPPPSSPAPAASSRGLTGALGGGS